MKTFLFRSLMGIFFGAFLVVVFTNLNILLGNNEMIDGAIFVKNSLGTIFCTWFFTVSPLYFEIRKLTLVQQTVQHFLTVGILYFPFALAIKWIPYDVITILLTLIKFIVIYFIFWMGFYLYFRYQAKKLNDDLTKL